MTPTAFGTNRRRLTDFWDSSRAYYHQAAATNSQASPERRLLLAYLSGGERLLDLGSGSCENALWLDPGCRYLGLDLSTAALALAAEEKRPGLRLRGDGSALPLAGESVDAVLSTYALEHFHDPGTTFLEAARVLRPGGLLLVVGSAWDLPYELPPSVHPRRRLEVTLRRTWRQFWATVSRRHAFDVVREPRVLQDGYVPDADAVYVVQSVLLVAFLEAVGFDVLEHGTLPHGPDPGGARGLLRRALRRFPLWRHGWGNALIVARRGARCRRPPFRLRYL